MDKISFSTLQLIHESEIDAVKFIEAKKEVFASIPSEFDYPDNGTFYKLFSELTDEYFWLVAEYGRPEPHRDNWVDIKTHEEETNKRKNTQVELTNQTFLFYSFTNKLLYLSNSKQIKLFSKILTEKSGNKLFAKRLIVKYEEFIALIKSVGRIKFTGYNNLFSADSLQFKALADLTGTSSPESFSLEATYNKATIIQFLNQLYQSKTENKIDKLVIAGIDEDGFEAIYNVDNFTTQLSINCKKNHEGVYEHETIKNEIKSKIGKK